MEAWEGINAMFSRFPHIGDTILKNLSFGDLADCRKVGRIWMQFIDSQRFYKAHIQQAIDHKAVQFYNQNGIINPEEKTPIHDAAIAGHNQVFERLWDAEIRTQRQINSPLHFAASLGHWRICSYIVASVKNLKSIFVCKEDGEIHIFSDLIPRNGSGDTPLHKAAFNNNATNFFKLILPRLRYDKNPKNFSGETPLHLAAKHGHLDTCEYIIDRITPHEVAVESRNSWTPLHHAAEKGHTQICQVIIEKVQDRHPRLPEYTILGMLISNVTPCQLAKINGHNETAALFD